MYISFVCDCKLASKCKSLYYRVRHQQFRNTSEVYRNAVYGHGSGPIWLNYLNCEGFEANIEECKHRGWESRNCDHGDDVSINCLPKNGELMICQ